MHHMSSKDTYTDLADKLRRIRLATAHLIQKGNQDLNELAWLANEAESLLVKLNSDLDVERRHGAQ